MYLVGEDHPNKRIAQVFLEGLIADRKRMVTDVEVFQEILHRYSSINRREAIQPAFDVLYGLADEVFSIERTDIELTKKLILEIPSLSARDSLHVAVMKRFNIREIVTFDRGFDKIQEVVRLPG